MTENCLIVSDWPLAILISASIWYYWIGQLDFMSSLSDELTKEKVQAIKNFLFLLINHRTLCPPIYLFSKDRWVALSSFGVNQVLDFLVGWYFTRRQPGKLCACVRYWPGHGLVLVLPLALSWSDTFQNTPWKVENISSMTSFKYVLFSIVLFYFQCCLKKF